MSIFYHLLYPTPLGEFSIVMRGEDATGTKFFVHADEATPAPSGIDVDVDIPFQKFEKVRPDYLQTTWGIPLFSREFIDSAPTGFLDEVQTIPAELHLRGGRSSYVAIKTRKYLPLVNADASKFSNIRGIKLLTKASFDGAADDFYVARDTEFRRVFVATERMVTLIKDKQLRMGYLPY